MDDIFALYSFHLHLIPKVCLHCTLSIVAITFCSTHRKYSFATRGTGGGNYLKALETPVLQQSEPHMSMRTPEFNRKQSSLNELILLFILIEKEEKLGKKMRLKD